MFGRVGWLVVDSVEWCGVMSCGVVWWGGVGCGGLGWGVVWWENLVLLVDARQAVSDPVMPASFSFFLSFF